MHEFLVRLPEGRLVVLQAPSSSSSDVLLVVHAARTRFLAPSAPPVRLRPASSSSSILSLEWDLPPGVVMGLVGGKGGFGAGLRAMGKKRGKADEQSFALCRDLHGNRLGQQNTQEQLRLAQQAEASGGAAATTPAWVLDRPSWADPVRSSSSTTTRQQQQPQQPQQQRDRRPVTPSVDFASTLARQLQRAEASTAEAIQQGLESKRARVEEEAGEEEEGVVRLSGEASVRRVGERAYTVTGRSDFATVAFAGTVDEDVVVDMLPLTDGLVQFGFMRESDDDGSTTTMEANLDGVGDVPGSFAVDFARGQFLEHGHQVSTEFGGGAMRVVVTSSASEYVFSSLRSGTKHRVSVDDEKKKKYRACVSLEQGESIEIRFSAAPPPKDHPAAVAVATTAASSFSLDFTSLATLELEGGDKLKLELQRLGLKFGGTVRQRAQRLLDHHRQYQ